MAAKIGERKEGTITESIPQTNFLQFKSEVVRRREAQRFCEGWPPGARGSIFEWPQFHHQHAAAPDHHRPVPEQSPAAAVGQHQGSFLGGELGHQAAVRGALHRLIRVDRGFDLLVADPHLSSDEL